MIHDVIIVGAGPAGSSASHFLSKRGLETFILDRSEFPRDKTCGDGLTPRALSVLDEMGILEEVGRRGFCMNQATVFAPSGDAITTEMPLRDDMPPYMLSIPRLSLDELVLARATASGGRFQGSTHVTGIERSKHGVLVRGSWKRKTFTAQARVAIVAIGASQKLLHNLGILKDAPTMILAARAYFDGLRPLRSHFEFHFDGVPLPGYGWIFPLSPTAANIGAGVLRSRGVKKRKEPSAKLVMEQFLQLPRMREMMVDARRVGSVKGYPLRTDFATAATHADRILLVGEAAGLVNPLTGEGVDYALESGKIAAGHLADLFAKEDLSLESMSNYDALLRARFQRLFRFSGRIRDWYLNTHVLNRLVRAAKKRDRLRTLFTDIVLGNADAAEAMNFRTLLEIAFSR